MFHNVSRRFLPNIKSYARRCSPFALACVLGSVGVLSFAHAASSAPNPPAASDPGAPTVGSLAPMLEGFAYNSTHVDITKRYTDVNGIFDREYDPILQKMQPGTRMQAMEAERDKKKAAFAVSFLEFGDTPLGFDTTGLVGEYSYKNHEYVQILRRDYGRRFFFYIGAPPNDHFWKLYDEVTLCDGCLWGNSYQEAVAKMSAKLGVVGRARPADLAKGYSRPYTEWQDATTHLRLIDRTSEKIVGVGFGSKSIEANLTSLRPNRMEDPFAMDPSVAAATRGGLSDPNGTNAPADAGPPPKKKKH
ncbi:MAG: hypothetical protein ABI421_03585 [Polyangiaceae bacterium]